MVPEPDVVDAHTHVVSSDVLRYPVRPGVPDEQDWHREHAVDTEELLALGEGCGVAGAVLVQAISCHGFDNRYVLDSARAHPARTVAVGSVQPGAPDAAACVRRDVREHGMRGVRIFSIEGPGAPIDTPAVREVVTVACELDVPVLLLGIEHQIPSVGTLAGAFPAARFVLDHCGFADLGGGSTFPHAGPLLALAPYENLRLKVSSINLLAAEEPEALWCLLVDRFGAHRLLWGTDFPHTRAHGYPGLVALGRTSTGSLGASDRALVLSGTARDLWPQLVPSAR
jgi:predicted TIM-barrel fold metal-dependent hydrolase